MAILRCENGHYYDDEKFSQCPHCQSMEEKKRDLDDRITIARNIFGGGVKKEQTPFPAMDPGCGGLEKEEKNIKTPIREEKEEEAAHAVLQGEKKWICGWLVCTKGVNRGMDYRICQGFNWIGRSASMEICIPGDKTISRQRHCAIVYDEKANQFFLLPGEGTATYVGGKLLTAPLLLRSRSSLEIGKGQFQFIAFCEGEETWKKN